MRKVLALSLRIGGIVLASPLLVLMLAIGFGATIMFGDDDDLPGLNRALSRIGAAAQWLIYGPAGYRQMKADWAEQGTPILSA